MTADIHLDVWHETARVRAQRMEYEKSALLSFEANYSVLNVTLNRAQVLDLQQKLAALEWPTPEAAPVEFDVERAR